LDVCRSNSCFAFFLRRVVLLLLLAVISFDESLGLDRGCDWSLACDVVVMALLVRTKDEEEKEECDDDDDDDCT
jgi:hypothetical protein